MRSEKMKFKIYCVNGNFIKFLECRSKVETLKEAVELGKKDNVATSNFKNFNNKKITNEILEIAKTTPELISIIKVKDWNKCLIIAISGRFEVSDEVCILAMDFVKKSLFENLQSKKSLIKQMKFLSSVEFYLKALGSDNLQILDCFNAF